MVVEDTADHVLLARGEVDLGGGQQRVTENELHVRQRQVGILCHPVGGGVPQSMQGGGAARRLPAR